MEGEKRKEEDNKENDAEAHNQNNSSGLNIAPSPSGRSDTVNPCK